MNQYEVLEIFRPRTDSLPFNSPHTSFKMTEIRLRALTAFAVSQASKEKKTEVIQRIHIDFHPYKYYDELDHDHLAGISELESHAFCLTCFRRTLFFIPHCKYCRAEKPKNFLAKQWIAFCLNELYIKFYAQKEIAYDSERSRENIHATWSR